MHHSKEQEERQRVIKVAESWLGTPYHHMGRVKGVGVDCGTFLCEVYHEAGVTDFIGLEYYPFDWHLHRDEEKYLEILLRYVRIVSRARAGDIIMYRFGRVASHSAIITTYPQVINCFVKIGVCTEYDGSSRLPFERRIGIFSPWGKV
jgi:cell wall-associated NlpC family hydrolase